MASMNLGLTAQQGRLPANPWMWLAVGGGLTLGSYVWTLLFGEIASDNRVILLALGLLCTAVGVNLRWNDRQTVYLQPWAPLFAGIGRLILVVVLAVVVLGTTALLALAFYEPDRTAWKPGVTSLVWLSVVPVSYFALKRCLKRNPEQVGLDADEEVALSLVVAASACLVGSLTLDLGGKLATDWDSIRLLLRVLLSVCLLGAALVLVSTRLRRLVVSLLIVLHFAGIATASLSAPPTPWIVAQIWTRVYRPYLEFMYLNNAYHFYAPEPGPASYIWFRLIYSAPDGQEYGWWYKVPELDDRGKSNHTVALEYQRFLCMTQSASDIVTPPGAVYTNDKGELDTHEIFKNRLQLIMAADKKDKAVIAVQDKYFRIPLEPNLPHLQQVMIPSPSSQHLYSSFVRFLALRYAQHPEHENWTLKSVKLYRVVHVIPSSANLSKGIPPTDPELYMPYYQGNYDTDGTRIVDNDPYLYWLLPILRAIPNYAPSKIRSFAALHAGDPNWVRPALQFHQLSDPPPWGQPDEEDRKLVTP